MSWQDVEVQCFGCETWFRVEATPEGPATLEDWQGCDELCECTACGLLVMVTGDNTRLPDSFGSAPPIPEFLMRRSTSL